MYTPGLWLLTAHLIADFPLQPDWIAKTKVDNVSRRTIHVGVHAFINIPIAWVLLPSIEHQIAFLVWITVTHFIIDSRRWVEPKDGWGVKWVWCIDQIMHLTSLSLALPFTYVVIPA